MPTTPTAGTECECCADALPATSTCGWCGIDLCERCAIPHAIHCESWEPPGAIAAGRAADEAIEEGR